MGDSSGSVGDPASTTRLERYHRPIPASNAAALEDCCKIQEMFRLWISARIDNAATGEDSRRYR